MALKINPSKLLPQSKSSSIVKTEKPTLKVSEKRVNIASALKIRDEKSFALSKDVIKPKKINDAEDVNNKLLKIDKFFKTEFTGSQKKAEEKRKEKEKKDFEEAENKLELPKLKGFSLPKLPLLPTFGILDRIKRFLFFTAVGWLLPKIIEFIPKLERFAQMIVGVYKFAESLFGKLFDGFTTLLKFGGDLKDKTIGFIAQIKAGSGGNFQKEFDKLEKQFNNFVNLSIVTGLLAADIGLAALDEFNKQRKKQPSGKPPKPGEPRKPSPKVTTGQGGKPGLGRGARVTTSKKPSIWQKLTGGLKSKFSSFAGKLAKPFGKFAGAAIPGLGAAIGFADARAREKSGDKLGAFLANLSAGLDVFTASVAVAGLAAAATGIGLPGAAVLGTAAGVSGTLSMAIDVVILIRDILKAVGLPAFSGGGRVLRKYQTGGVSGENKSTKPVLKPVTRTLKQTKRRSVIKTRPPKSQPGRDVGGETSIKGLFPFTGKRFITFQEWKNSGTSLSYNEYLVKERKEEGKKPNPYNVLTSTSKILKEIPLVGGIMGAAVDVVLGQKPDKKIYKSLSSGISYLVENLANQRVDNSIGILTREIRGFEDGGYVSPSRELKNNYNDISSGDLLSKILGTTIEQRVSAAIQNIEKELQKKSKEDISTSDPGSINDMESFDYEVEGGETPSKYPGRYLAHGYKGRDYQIEVGRAITVFAPGVVTYAQYNPGGFGRLVIVKHPNGQESYYAHLSKINVRVGESIGQSGTVIGLTGGDPSDPQAGRTTGPHLHFELRDSRGNRITAENSGDSFFRFGKIKSAKPRVGTLRPGEAGKPGQKFTIAQLVTLAKKAGFKGNNAAVAAAVAMAESGGKSGELNDNPRTGDLSYGLWQINMIGDMGPERRKRYGLKSNEDLFDPATNANVAYKMSGGSNFSAWSTYKDSLHVKFLPEAQKALQRGDVVLPQQPRVPSLRPNVPEMGGQQIDLNYGMQTGEEFTFTGPDGKQYKAHKTAKGFDFYTTGFFGLGSQKIDTTAGKNQQIVDAFIKERQKNLRGQSRQPGSSSAGKVSVYSGHADMTKNSGSGFGTPGGVQKLINPNFLSNEAYINDLVARKVAAKASGVAVYRPPIKTDADRDPNSNWERAKRDVSGGITPIEMHHDEPRGTAGLMMGKNYDSRMKKNKFIKSLHLAYGAHPNTEEKGFFKNGGAILEISRLTPSILKDQKTISAHVEKESSRIAGALKSTQMQDGGSVLPSKSSLPIPNSFASYDDPSASMVVAYQPILVKQQIPTSSSSNNPIAFPVPVMMSVNNMEQVFNSSRGY